MEPILEDLLGSKSKARLLRLFFHYPEENFELKEIVKKIALASKEINENLKLFLKGKIIKQNNKKQKHFFSLNKDFPYFSALQDIVINSPTVSVTNFLKKISRVGKIKFLLFAGKLLKSTKTRLDILIVGEDLKTTKINNLIQELENESVFSLDYAVMSSKEFLYRYEMHDGFLRDVFDFPHQILINKLRIKP